jgi:hypothetical protein
MKLTRRMSARLLAGAVAGTSAMLAQTTPSQSRAPADPDLQAARNDLFDNARRIAQVKLPRITEPAFKFRP